MHLSEQAQKSCFFVSGYPRFVYPCKSPWRANFDMTDSEDCLSSDSRTFARGSRRPLGGLLVRSTGAVLCQVGREEGEAPRSARAPFDWLHNPPHVPGSQTRGTHHQAPSVHTAMLHNGWARSPPSAPHTDPENTSLVGDRTLTRLAEHCHLSTACKY